MKVTKREQVLLGILFIVLLCYGFYNFVYLKQNQKITELKASKDSYSQKWELAKAKITSENERKKQYKNLNSKIFNATDFGLPQAPEELVLTWIGNGAPVLIARVLEWAKVQTGKDFSDAEMEQVKERFNVYYAENL